jgi:hypothetical protein
MTLAEGAALELSRILHMEEVIADEEDAALEQGRLDEIALREEKEITQLIG